MNTIKISNHVRLIAFFLTAVMLVCTFGFTVDGWQGENAQMNPSTDTSRGDKYFPDNPTVTLPVPDEPEIYIPPFTNYLTGLETTESLSKKAPLALIMECNGLYYGISKSDILIEIPTENESTRFVSFISDIDNLGKIGAITKGRGYITNIASFFGGIPIFNDCDDMLPYESCDIRFKSLDLNLNNSYHYTEFSSKVYTNGELLAAGLGECGINEEKYDVSMPYGFVDFGLDEIILENKAKKVSIIKDDGTVIELCYDEEKHNFTYFKNKVALTDSLNGKTCDFKNCLILFADSVTYDNSNYCQTVVDTIGSGKGIYITNGGYTDIRWTSTQAGVMNFYLSNGEKLNINRGNSFICYLKSSMQKNVIFT